LDKRNRTEAKMTFSTPSGQPFCRRVHPDQIGRAIHLVQIDVTAATMIGREVKDDLHVLERAFGVIGFQQVKLEKFKSSIQQVIEIRP
jgi:hypothetical protein